MSWQCFWWGNAHLFQLGFPTVSFLLASPYQHSRHLEFLGCFQLNVAEQNQLKLIFHELHENRWADKGGSTNSQFIDCGVSLTVPLLAHQRICRSVQTAGVYNHKVVVEPTFVKVYQKKKIESWHGLCSKMKSTFKKQSFFLLCYIVTRIMCSTEMHFPAS